jgi:hypothetical protein
MSNNFLFARNLSVEQKKFTFGVFKDIANNLDLTASQMENIEKAYRGVGGYLSNSGNSLLKNAEIYPQGSIRLRTAVKPINSDEYDVDLILYLPNAKNASRDSIMNAVRNHLKNHAVYEPLLTDLPRGFRIGYKNDYHLDITPGKDYLDKHLEGQPLWVPDKVNFFKETNSKGIAEWFDKSAQKVPKFTQTRSSKYMATNDSVEELPDQSEKSLLSIIVQILKRHRDQWANDKSNKLGEFKPISVLITTIATHAYNHIISMNKTYENEYDILLDVIDFIPNYIDRDFNGDYLVANPSMADENYAEKWNRKKDGLFLQHSFYDWHKCAINTVEKLAGLTNQGTDKLFGGFTDSFGIKPVEFAQNQYIQKINQERETNNLGVNLSTGAVLSIAETDKAIASTSGAVSKVKDNTFYGD